jgi:ribonuclease P protein component
MLPKRYRLRRRPDVQRVRRQGRRWRHPLAILLLLPAEQKMNQMNEVAGLERLPVSRFAISASRRVGHAVARNRAKRLLRAAVHSNLTEIEPGWDCLLIARQGTPHASYDEVETAIKKLLSRAQILIHHPRSDGSQGV